LTNLWHIFSVMLIQLVEQPYLRRILLHQNAPKLKLHLPGCHSMSNRTIHCSAHLHCVWTYLWTSMCKQKTLETIPPSIKKQNTFIHNKFYTHPDTVKNHNKLLWHLLLFENVGKRKPPWPKPGRLVDLVRSNVYHAFQRNPSILRWLFGENGCNRTRLNLELQWAHTAMRRWAFTLSWSSQSSLRIAI